MDFSLSSGQLTRPANWPGHCGSTIKLCPQVSIVVCWCGAPSATATSSRNGWTSRMVASTFDRLAIGCLCLGHGMRILFAGHGSKHDKHTSLSSSLSAPLCALPSVLLLGALYVPRPSSACTTTAPAPLLTPSCCCCSRWLLFPRYHAMDPVHPVSHHCVRCIHHPACFFVSIGCCCLLCLLLCCLPALGASAHRGSLD